MVSPHYHPSHIIDTTDLTLGANSNWPKSGQEQVASLYCRISLLVGYEPTISTLPSLLISVPKRSLKFVSGEGLCLCATAANIQI